MLAIICLVVCFSCIALPASAQEDISARVKAHQEKVRRDIEAAKERMRQHRASFGGSGSSFRGSGNSFGRGNNTFGSGLNSDDYHAPGATNNNGNPYLRTYTPPAPPPGVPSSYLQPPPDQMHHYDPRNSLPPNVRRAQTPTHNALKHKATRARQETTPTAIPTVAPRKIDKPHPVAPLPAPDVSSGAPKSNSSAAATTSPVPSKFDYSNSVNLDALKSTNAELTVHGTKFDIKGNIDWNRVRDAAFRGAAIGGLVGLVMWLAVRGLSMMGGAQSSGPRPGMESRGSGAANISAAFIGVATVAGMTWWNGFANDRPSKESVKLMPVHSNEFSCRVLMPSPYSKIYVKMVDPQTLGSKPIYYTAVQYDGKNAGCVMGYAKLPPLPPNTMFQTYYFDTNKALDGATKGSVERIGGVIKSQYPITLKNGRHPGREADGTLPKDKGGGLFRQRIYISGGNYYQVAVYGDPDWVNSNDAYKFLDSFDLIEQ